VNDLELLRRYAQDGSETAFAELTRRYVSLVYSAALRQVHNAADAEDATQAVFLLLARKARALAAAGVVVPAWLLRAAHFVSRTLLRAHARRRRHETRAATMTTTGRSGSTGGGPTPSEPDWEQIAPLLDEAIASLGDVARDALVLRFFRGKSYRDVAERLAIGEPAARQRVSRAVEQLRAYFARRGIVLSASALETSIVAHAVQPAPHALAALAAKAGVKGAAVAAKHAALAHGAAFGMIPVAAKAGVAAALVVLVGVASLALYQSGRDRQRATLEAANGTPARAVVQSSISAPIRGRVLNSSGRPAAGAEVMLARASSAVAVYGPARPGVLVVSAAPDGTFEFPAQPDATAVVARSNEGVAQVRVADLQKTGDVRLVPWGRIEGTLRVGGTPQAGQTIDLSRTGGSLDEWYAWRIMHEARTRTDGRGHFVFARVIPLPPGSPQQHELKWQVRGSTGMRMADLWVGPRETAHVELGGSGRPVIGRLAIPAGLPPFVGQLVAQPPATRPAGGAALALMPRIIPVTLTADGSFRADDVPAGRYNLVFVSQETVGVRVRVAEALAVANTTVDMPEMAGGRSDEPLDVGTLPVHVNAVLTVGREAPDFTATDANGKPIRLSDFHGKYVLLYVHRLGIPDDGLVNALELKAIQDRFGGRADFALLDIPVDDGGRPLAGSRPAQVLSRLVGRIAYTLSGAPAHPAPGPAAGLPPVYLSGTTRLFVIGPDGKCIARSLDARTVFSRLSDVLPRTPVSNPRIRIRVEHRAPTNGASVALVSDSTQARAAVNIARSARFSIVDGERGDGSGGPGVLNDGRLAPGEDDPAASFFFSYGSLEGRFRMDLDQPAAIRQINTYSRHRSHRGPQVYSVYGSDGLSSRFDPRPRIGTDPASCGWTKIADVDTRPAAGPDGGQYAVSLAATGAALIGRYKHLLFVTFVTETDDDWGHTFFSEVEAFGQEGKP
jgi:RNA polymerase sigma factor (sigma-70 family)